MRRTTVLGTVMGAVAVAALVAGCTSSNNGSAGKLEGGAASSAAVGAPALPAGATVNGGADSGGSAKGNDALGGTGGGGTVGGKDLSGSTPSLVADPRAVIRTAHMTVGVKDSSAVAAQADNAEHIAAVHGGEVFDDERSSGLDATATLTLKVPPAQLVATLDALSGLGKEQSRDLTSTDVTTEVADVNARVTSALAAITRLRTLYASASKVSDVIAIESELSQRESDLESLQAQQRALSSETQLATITLELTTMPAPVKPHHHHYSGVGGAFARGWHGFVVAGEWLFTALATVLPFAILVALIAAGALAIRRRRPAPTPAPAADGV